MFVYFLFIHLLFIWAFYERNLFETVTNASCIKMIMMIIVVAIMIIIILIITIQWLCYKYLWSVLGLLLWKIVSPSSDSATSASLMHNNPQRCTKVYGMCPIGHKDWLMLWRCFCRISYSCDFCGCSCGYCLTMHISFSLRCALQKNIFYLSGHIKAQAFSI